MTKDNRYSITGRNGKSVIAERDGARYIGIDETNIELSIKVLNAISPIVTAFRNTSSYGEDC